MYSRNPSALYKIVNKTSYAGTSIGSRYEVNNNFKADQINVVIEKDDQSLESGAFTKVPDKVLVKIFELLDRDDVLKMTMTCKRFNEVFSNNLEEFFVLFHFGKGRPLPDIKRAYKHLIVHFRDIEWEANPTRFICMDTQRNCFGGIPVMAKMGPSLRKLRFLGVHVNMETLRDILDVTRNIQTLTFIDSIVYAAPGSSWTSRMRTSRLPYLKELYLENRQGLEARIFEIGSIIHKCSNIFECFRHSVTNLEILKLNGESYEFVDVERFVSRQKNLKQFSMEGGNFFDGDFSRKVPFQLEYFRVQWFSIDEKKPKEFFDNFEKFIRTQTELKNASLTVIFKHDSVASINHYLGAVEHILGLDSILDFAVCFNDEGKRILWFFETTRAFNMNLVSFSVILKPEEFTRAFTRNLAKIAPNLTTLEVKWPSKLSTSTETIDAVYALKLLVKLRNLHLKTIDSEVLRHLTIDCLKVITLTVFDCKLNDWKVFINSNPNLESIAVHFFKLKPEDDDDSDPDEFEDDDDQMSLTYKYVETAISLNRLKYLHFPNLRTRLSAQLSERIINLLKKKSTTLTRVQIFDKSFL